MALISMSSICSLFKVIAESSVVTSSERTIGLSIGPSTDDLPEPIPVSTVPPSFGFLVAGTSETLPFESLACGIGVGVSEAALLPVSTVPPSIGLPDGAETSDTLPLVLPFLGGVGVEAGGCEVVFWGVLAACAPVDAGPG